MDAEWRQPLSRLGFKTQTGNGVSLPHDRIFTPREVGNYVYCATAWGLTRRDEAEAARRQGLRKHAEFSKRLASYIAAEGGEIKSLLTGILLILIAVAAYMLLTAPVVQLPSLVVALVAIIGVALAALGVVFLGKSYRLAQEVEKLRRTLRLTGRTIPYYDAMFASEEYGLVGRPDAIDEESDGTLLPIDKKSARPPASGAWDNDEAQVLAYSLMIEDFTGVSPKRARIEYGEEAREIAFDVTRRQWIISVIKRMREHTSHELPLRSHNNPRKCSACFVREDCPQDLTRIGSVLH